jgi:hypothetical protein
MGRFNRKTTVMTIVPYKGRPHLLQHAERGEPDIITFPVNPTVPAAARHLARITAGMLRAEPSTPQPSVTEHQERAFFHPPTNYEVATIQTTTGEGVGATYGMDNPSRIDGFGRVTLLTDPQNGERKTCVVSDLRVLPPIRSGEATDQRMAAGRIALSIVNHAKITHGDANQLFVERVTPSLQDAFTGAGYVPQQTEIVSFRRHDITTITYELPT